MTTTTLTEGQIERLEDGLTTLEDLAREIPGSAVIDDHLVIDPSTIHASDGYGEEVQYSYRTHAEAAQEYVDTGWWEDPDRTIWFHLSTYRYGYSIGGDYEACDEQSHVIDVHPKEPECAEGRDHEWHSPIEVLGGISENPGCWGHGAGMIIWWVCRHCGRYRRRDTFAQDPSTGQQGMESLEYREPDDVSLAWIHD